MNSGLTGTQWDHTTGSSMFCNLKNLDFISLIIVKKERRNPMKNALSKTMYTQTRGSLIM